MDGFADERLSAETHENLGDLYRSEEKKSFALESFMTAHTLYESIGDQSLSGVTSLKVGVALLESQDIEEATWLCRKSLKYAELSSVLTTQLAACECLYTEAPQTRST